MNWKSIVAIGASSCFGKGDTSGAGGFVEIFKQHHEAQDPAFNNLYNLGIPGDTTTGMLQRFSDEAARRQPELVLISLGSNDSARIGSVDGPWVTALDQFGSNLMELIRQSKMIAKQTVVISAYPIAENKTSPFRDSGKFYTNENLLQFVNTSKHISNATLTPYLDAWELFARDSSAAHLAEDGLHCGPKGHASLAKELENFLSLLSKR